MKLNFIIPLTVYPFDVMVSINQSNDEIEKSLKAKSIKNDTSIKFYSFTKRIVSYK